MRKLLAISAALVFVAPLSFGTVFGQGSDPVEIVKAYSAAVNNKDFAALFAMYADDAVVRSPAGLFIGKEAIGNWLRKDGEASAETIDDVQVNGNTVISSGTISLTRFKGMGIDPVNFRAERIIENGKIKFFSPAVMLTPDQQAQLRAAAPPTPPPAVDPVEVVKNYIMTANTGNFDRTFAFYADGAVVKNPTGLFVGKEAIATWLRQDVQTTRATPQEFQVINGGTTVINTGTVSLARFKAMGIDPVAYRSDYLIEGDKIKYFSPSVILTAEQQEKVRAAGPPAAAPAPAVMPATGGTGAGQIWWVLTFCGAVILGGMGLALRRRLR